MHEADDMKVLVFGGHGWIGKQVCASLEVCGVTYEVSPAHADSMREVTDNLLETNPTHILCAIDTHDEWIDSVDNLDEHGHLKKNIKDNLVSPLQLAILCAQYDIHFTYMGTGCIFDREDPCEHLYTEQDKADFFGSTYSIIKGYTDMMMTNFSNALNLRIKTPITDFNHPKNMITKLVTSKQIYSVANSMTVLPVMLPIMIDMMRKRIIGTYNFTNPGHIKHCDILQLYKELVDPTHKWDDTCNKGSQEKQSNCILGTKKLEVLYPDTPNIEKAIRECLKNWH